ncbi:3-isopropylmalate dehydratase large subunit [Hirschia baltica]|uniref:3-isopropylmalate dehydratase large subunit n=1 Tax=Hirschia baltica (strain ATCC 49814 / DSM 5838 / IFAM 1418) TaxID=582402 RepID=C6XJC6_HIRBI|nr:3-isopropylmalate dehydratase large subunit [Hirschia baltica]ACT59221.1 3-isopropylmalate dehydratase, large subunit [Hirschia baltica ATCC 49814]
MALPSTLYDKLIDIHTVCKPVASDQEILLYIDRTVLNEYTSPQAFTGIRNASRSVYRPKAALAVIDHVNSTHPKRTTTSSLQSENIQMSYFEKNCSDFNIELFDIYHKNQGIEHVVMPELGLVLPGLIIAAGDSHTTTYGAFGSIGFGIGTSDIEHLLATQTLPYQKLLNMKINISGEPPAGISAKDIIMSIVRNIGADGARGYAVEFTGPAITKMSIEGRMTVCNMAVECGARVALIAPDHKVYEYLKGKTRAPQNEQMDEAILYWQTLQSSPDAIFEKTIDINIRNIEPMVTWGTSPDQAVPITGFIPNPQKSKDPANQKAMERALKYMGLKPGTKLTDLTIDFAFIGSCTNARIEDLRAAANVLKGRKIAPQIRAMVVPGSSQVRQIAEQEGIDKIFIDAGFEWRQSGCSMCLAMNDDIIAPGKRCAPSTNRNFEGRQGVDSRTHLMSPEMVAAAAISGHLCDVRNMQPTHAF